MDIQTALIGVGVFAVSAIILLLISVFGIKEKSYEEALAEQRQQTNALLGIQHRPKSKEKKVKKTTKKPKEKQPNVPVDLDVAEESDDKTASSSSTANTHQKLHVEFKEPAVEEVALPEQTASKKRGKKEKVRPILIHKSVENIPVIPIVDVLPSNHFEQLHPKDDLELLHLHIQSKEDVSAKTESNKEKPSKSKQNGLQETKAGKPKQNSTEAKGKVQESVREKVTKEKVINSSPEIQKSKKLPEKVPPAQQVVAKDVPAVEVAVVPSTSSESVTSGSKEKKKKKSDFNVLQEIAAKDGDINLPLLLNAVRKAELSRSEVQILIDLLLNKQHEAPAVVDQWSEGKADPVQKLKKQLAEKEKALGEEQEALQGVQAKLREVRAEQAAEKMQLQQRVRGLEEALQAKHLELQAVNGRIHSQNQKLQQIQAQMNEESLAMHKLHEENNALQLQRQQIEIHIAQAQEAEATIQDLQGRNNQLTMELHSLTEQNMATKDHQQGIIVQLQHQVNLYKGELDEKENYTRQFEELRRDLEHRLGIAIRNENELKVEIGQLKTACQQNAEEVRRLEHGKGQALEEIRNLQKQKDELDHALSQVKVELHDVQDEKAELQQIKANGLAQENQHHKEELLNLHNELSSAKLELQFVEKKYVTDLDESKNVVFRLQKELDEQKVKNNELRQKNWKVMEALKVAETKAVAPTIQIDEIVSKVRTEEQDLHRKFMERLFPDLSFANDLTCDKWNESAEKTIKQYISDLENSKTQDNQGEITKLQAQIKHYKTIIDDTEGILKKLENHIEQEEIHWRNELRSKESEIEVLKQRHSTEIIVNAREAHFPEGVHFAFQCIEKSLPVIIDELQTKVEQLELRIRSEQQEKGKVLKDFETLKSQAATMVEKVVVDQLSEELNSLKEQIVIEQRKNLPHKREDKSNDLIMKEQNNISSNGPSIEAPIV
ncbi:kinectin-like isoform X2 [Photinus pyralis]|uniref:kinectin-like isoform X2 n=1 Tax=Photinus pyralis TaxID=7054 RepID=UPI00126762F9|nr:kinectin-like isoform X2 [Photinus pyralis]